MSSDQDRWDLTALLAFIDADRAAAGPTAPNTLYVAGPGAGLPESRFTRSQTVAGMPVHASTPVPDEYAFAMWGWSAPSDIVAIAYATEVTQTDRATGERADADAVVVVARDGTSLSQVSVPGQPAQRVAQAGGRIGMLLHRCLGHDVPWTPDQVSVADYAAGWIAAEVAVELDRVRVALPTQAATLTEGIGERHTLQYASGLAWQFSDHGRYGVSREQAQQIHRVADGSEPVLMLEPSSRRTLIDGLRAVFADLTWVSVLQHGDSADLFATVLPPPILTDPAWGGDGLIAAFVSKHSYPVDDVLQSLPTREAAPVRQTLLALGLPVD